MEVEDSDDPFDNPWEESRNEKISIMDKNLDN